MNKFNITLLLITALSLMASASNIKYSALTIPEDLKKGMYAVVRNKEISYVINARNNHSVFYREAITILDSRARKHANVSVYYDKMTSIKHIKATIYDALGNEIKKIKSSDLQDMSTFDGFSLFSDSRVKTANLSQASYPYTIEFEYELQNNFLYSLPDFFLYDDDEVSAQEIVLTISYPEELKPRYKCNRISEPTINKIGTYKDQMKWSFNNVIPEKFESHSPDYRNVIPSILLSPVEFEYGGYAGKMDTWQNYGLWQLKLNEGKNDLPQTTRNKINELTKSVTSVEEKVKIVYEFMQNKTRYVNIVEGIGGLQPFPASLVDQVGYGDCKALSNYTISLLSSIGVKAYYTKIRAGENDSEIRLDFPNHQTNHIIVAVPNKKDTIWLECTSQTNAFGYLGSFTSDRHALMVTDMGGVVVKTPAYTQDQNIESRSAEVVVDKTGNAKATVRTRYSGLRYEYGNLDRALSSGADDQKKWIQENTGIPSFDIATFSMTNRKEKIPSATVNVNYVLNRYATLSGKRIFLTPNLMNRSTYIPEKLDNRKTSVVVRTPYMEFDTIRFTLPEEVYPEFMPEPFVIKSKFGEYESSFKVDQGSLIYIRRLKMNKGTYPPESYQELIDFYKNMNKADNVKMVFVSKT